MLHKVDFLMLQHEIRQEYTVIKVHESCQKSTAISIHEENPNSKTININKRLMKSAAIKIDKRHTTIKAINNNIFLSFVLTVVMLSLQKIKRSISIHTPLIIIITWSCDHVCMSPLLIWSLGTRLYWLWQPV